LIESPHWYSRARYYHCARRRISKRNERELSVTRSRHSGSDFASAEYYCFDDSLGGSVVTVEQAYCTRSQRCERRNIIFINNNDNDDDDDDDHNNNNNDRPTSGDGWRLPPS